MPLTDQQIVDQTNQLAHRFYKAHGYQRDPGFDFHKAHHPQERLMWELACIAQEDLTQTDAQNAADELE